MAQTVKHLPTIQETRVWSLGQEDLLEKEMATHSVLLPGKSHGWRSLEEPTVHGVTKSQTWLSNFIHFHSVIGPSQVVLVVKNLPAKAKDRIDTGLMLGLGRSPWRWAWQPIPVFLPRESQGQSFLLRRNMSLGKIHCYYIIISTELKGKHTLKQNELFCCVTISSGLKENNILCD